MKKISTNDICKAIIAIFVLAGTFFAADKLMGEDFSPLISWWLTLIALGIAMFPLVSVLFSGFHDGGFQFSKTIGIAVSGWLLWYLSSMKLLKFTRANTIIVSALCFVLSLVFLFVKAKLEIKKSGDTKKGLSQKVSELVSIDSHKLVSILCSEAIFTLIFVMWVYLRCYKPEAYGTEKFMDYGFMTAMLRADYMPAFDPWLSGHSINYYYVGQYLSAYLTRLSGVTAGYGYNLMLMTIAGMGFSLPYTIVVNLSNMHLSTLNKINDTVKSCFTTIAGVLAGISVSFISNLHYLVYGRLIPNLRDILGLKEAFESVGYTFKDYWFPDATRYIGYNPVTNDKTIHEFPVYSFVLGDLHAHVINIMFVLTVVGLLLAFLQKRRKQMDLARLSGVFAGSGASKKIFGIESFFSEVFNPIVICIGFFIGLFHMTNYWDYPIYFVVAGAVILFSNAVIYNFKLETIKLTALHAVVVLLVAKIVSLPFALSFNKIASSVNIAENHTPLYQLAILWGLPIICVIVFLVVCVRNLKLRQVFGENSKSHVGSNALFRFIGNLSSADLFALVLGLCAIGLVLIPEIVYVKDIYTGDFKRANTMFKLTFQAFILFGMFMGYAVTKAVFFAKTKTRRICGVLALVLIILSTGYFFKSVNSWFGDVTDRTRFKGIDASAFIYGENYEDAKAIDWINNNIEGAPVILEVNGASYTYNERVSVLTGCPTVLGWKTHEWLWQSDETGKYPESLTERENDIKTIYTSESASEVKQTLEKYDVEYIYVGSNEHQAFDRDVNDELISSLGDIVYPADCDRNYLYDTTYIVKIKK